ncbi:MAG: hypothetical protein MI757_14080 [Pirellulales bacterium]|nr:hypothetical protein [Pirellulales bacterium]
MKKAGVFADIKTDVPGRTCQFKVTKANYDYKAKLKELAKTNKHLKGFSIKE